MNRVKPMSIVELTVRILESFKQTDRGHVSTVCIRLNDIHYHFFDWLKEIFELRYKSEVYMRQNLG